MWLVPQCRLHLHFYLKIFDVVVVCIIIANAGVVVVVVAAVIIFVVADTNSDDVAVVVDVAASAASMANVGVVNVVTNSDDGVVAVTSKIRF